mmetsp:Transcript_172746/g.553736  ORF Transcript_172746/g.553736 Transcript_172746/m.553736 type:complete len:222 (+) Transcript_172746:518-1183(+)
MTSNNHPSISGCTGSREKAARGRGSTEISTCFTASYQAVRASSGTWSGDTTRRVLSMYSSNVIIAPVRRLPGFFLGATCKPVFNMIKLTATLSMSSEFLYSVRGLMPSLLVAHCKKYASANISRILVMTCPSPPGLKVSKSSRNAPTMSVSLKSRQRTKDLKTSSVSRRLKYAPNIVGSRPPLSAAICANHSPTSASVLFPSFPRRYVTPSLGSRLNARTA